MARVLSDKEVHSYQQDGFVIIKNFFSKAEIDKLYKVATGDQVMKENAVDLNDQTGKKTRRRYLQPIGAK